MLKGPSMRFADGIGGCQSKGKSITEFGARFSPVLWHLELSELLDVTK